MGDYPDNRYKGLERFSTFPLYKSVVEKRDQTKINHITYKLTRQDKSTKQEKIPDQKLPVYQYELITGPVQPYEIFAYCSKNYEDAYNFVIDSWTKPENVTKVIIYTDWDLKSNNPKVEIRNMFQPSSEWIIGTGRRVDVIKHYSEENKDKPKNVLFLDIDCYLVKDVSEVFSKDFDIGITRLYCGSNYANSTATAGLWFTKLTPGYYNFIQDWFNCAEDLKSRRIGIQNHKISYVQYSFTRTARRNTDRYKVLPLNEKIYNSEHSDTNKWYHLIEKHKPKILHYKGRRFRDQNIVKTSLEFSK